MKQHLFILGINNGGSTVLYNSFYPCKNAIKLPLEGYHYFDNFAPMAGETFTRLWTESQDIFADPTLHNWDAIKKNWGREWDKELQKKKTNHPIFIEKTPSNCLRAEMIETEFTNPYFIVTIRNPYAVSEGIKRLRLRLNNNFDIVRGARHWVKVAIKQIENINKLKHVIWFTYEEMCNKPDIISKKIIDFCPDLHDFNFNKTKESLNNLNTTQINRLSKKEIKIITDELRPHKDILDFFGYELME